jgi:phosphopantetheinyl transferase
VALFFQQNINQSSKLAIWKIDEPELFYTELVTISTTISHPHKRLQHLAGRYLLPFLFADFPHNSIEIAETRKPFLPTAEFQFSISHCADFAAAIVSKNKAVGIDIEMITERVHKIKHKYLHATEQAFVNDYPIEKQTELLTLLWSAKEAMFKWWGRGDIDFSEAMQIQSFELKESGVIYTSFKKEKFETALELNYKIMDQMCLVWVITAPNIV